MAKKNNRYFDSSKGKDSKSSSNTSKVDGVKPKSSKGKKKFRKNAPKPPSELNANGMIEVTAKLKSRKFRIKREKYPGAMPIPVEKLKKYSRGEGLGRADGVKHPLHLEKLRRKETKIAFSEKLAARTELLLNEDIGYLEADEGETTTQFTQKQIVESVDIATATKHFELQLPQFGPYRMRYSRNGRHLLLGGKMGHVAAFDWVTKHLHCEINVMETIHDVCWMHLETMFAVAQKGWVYMYDKKGTEIHCLKKLSKVLRMEFLPYHFLLATGSEDGFLSWLDISIGEMVNQFRTHLGRVSIMKQNPYNGVLCVGQSKGVVSMWSPNVKSPLASLLCHKAPLTALAIDPKGVYMATSAVDRSIKVWDVRNLNGPLQTYYLGSAASQLELSQNNLLSVAMGNVVEVYRDFCTQQTEKPYLLHKMNAYVENMNFCPYEDVLGVGTDRGFVSLIVPGSGEANFDALESNPYQTKSQRREGEVKSLLDKLQPEFICLNPTALAEVDLPTLKHKIESHNRLLRLKPQKVDYTPRNKTKRKGTPKIARNKKIVRELATKEFVKDTKHLKIVPEKKEVETKSFGVLDRFVKKK
ncbi:WD repeat-containing protein 46 [Arctopsyche grandis]|uniref:WD repeat-containing protein 46 n=1 Tax=Arctopsyche grandis TaxID=121162 RepID=UPI00406D913C